MKILIVDDHVLFRAGIRHVLPSLAEEVEVLEASDFPGGLALAVQRPDLDLVLLDLGLPGMRGIDAVLSFRARLPEMPVVVLSATDDVDLMRQALNAGIAGFIHKSSSAQVMLKALGLVMAGTLYLPPQLAALLRIPTPMPANGLHALAGIQDLAFDLTARQRQVLALLVEGLSNKEIGRELGLAPGTVKHHLNPIFSALRVRNRTEAALVARRLRLGRIPNAFPPDGSSRDSEGDDA